MKKYIFPLSIALIVVLPTRLWAIAAVVFDPTNYAQLVTSGVTLSKQLTQLTNEAANVKKQLDSLKQLAPSQYQWSNAQDTINQLGDVVNQTNGLSYNARDLNKQFQQTFPGYKPPEDYDKQYQNISDKSINTMNGVLQSTGTNASDFQNENTRLQFLQRQSQSAQGQTQAIQAASQIASEQVTQTQLLRQAVDEQTNAQATYYAAQMQKEASSRAEENKIIGNGSITAPTVGHSGNKLTTPDA